MKLFISPFSITFTGISLIFILIFIYYLTSINPFPIINNLIEKQKESSKTTHLFPSPLLLSNSGSNRDLN